ncbi:hypothetical protein [Tsuneonella suprasediminis]|uniref:hypothetical protein n=1 Tax=Tsuneonella suprasediminis TaxID=2306996 RepID=UPI00140238A0|nr:hypothetical protein [Tsuneonella suprasediminis]
MPPLIERLVPACEGQFGSRFEILLVNDGSCDDSWQKICDHANQHTSIHQLTTW